MKTRWFDPKKVLPKESGEYLTLFPDIDSDDSDSKNVILDVSHFFHKGDYVETVFDVPGRGNTSAEKLLDCLSNPANQVYAEEDSFWELDPDKSWVVQPMLWAFPPEAPEGLEYVKFGDEE